jgi:hypothetical protein
VIVGVDINYIRWTESLTKIAIAHVTMQELVQTAQVDEWVPKDFTTEPLYSAESELSYLRALDREDAWADQVARNKRRLGKKGSKTHRSARIVKQKTPIATVQKSIPEGVEDMVSGRIYGGPRGWVR